MFEYRSQFLAWRKTCCG